MNISPLRTKLLFGVITTQLPPKEAVLYKQHRALGKHSLGRFRCNTFRGKTQEEQQANFNFAQFKLRTREQTQNRTALAR